MSEVGQNVAELDTPALWVDLDVMERNIEAVAQELAQAGVHWRPHIKGIKVPAIVHRLLDAGAIGVTCAKLGEAEVMAAAGVRDILIANQIVTAAKIQRLVNLRRYADVKVAVDDYTNVSAIGAAAVEKGVEVGLVIEIDTGMKRAGVVPGEATVQLARHIVETAGVVFKGLMSWEGHNLSFSDPAEKKRGIEQSIGELIDSVELCKANGMEVEIVSGGGSGTYTITAHIPGMTEIQAGGAIFCDRSYQRWGVPFDPAIFVRTTVTSRPAPDRIICDAGFKTVTRFVPPAQPVGFEVENVVYSAEHGIITLAEPNESIKVGDGFDMVLAYGDATVHMHDRIYGMRNGVVEAAWDVQARGKLR